ncbi:MAG: hypothetical protein KC422_23045 [Trueperaceae bacterium]|nr:hypothetical protein [Trueperaceae bacterium]
MPKDLLEEQEQEQLHPVLEREQDPPTLEESQPTQDPQEASFTSPEFEDSDAPLPEFEEPEEIPVIPFTTEEVFDGTVWIFLTAVKSRKFFRNEKEAETFKEGLSLVVTTPPISTSLFIESLDVGGALASYGIHKNSSLVEVLDRVQNLPPWLRLVLFAAGMTAAVVNAIRSVERGRLQDSPRTSNQPADFAGSDDA